METMRKVPRLTNEEGEEGKGEYTLEGEEGKGEYTLEGEEDKGEYTLEGEEGKGMKLWRKVDLPCGPVTMYKLEPAIESSPESEDFHEEWFTWKYGCSLEASDDDEVDDDDGYVHGGGNVHGHVYIEEQDDGIYEEDNVDEDDKVDD